MTIESAIADIEDLIVQAEGDHDIPSYVYNALDGLYYALRYISAVRPVLTEHDSAAEFESWDRFFEDRRKEAGGR